MKKKTPKTTDKWQRQKTDDNRNVDEVGPAKLTKLKVTVQLAKTMTKATKHRQKKKDKVQMTQAKRQNIWW